MQRISIIGPPGSGKSTLARVVGASLGLPVVHLDREFWLPHWVEPDRGYWLRHVAQLVATDAWVMEGGYSATYALRLARSQALVWLDLPRSTYFPRAVWRSIRNYGSGRADIGEGCREQFEIGFFRDWVWTYPSRARPRDAALMAGLPAHIRGVVLHQPRDVRQFVAGLPGSLAGGASAT